jgi:hypothetical protein
VPADATVNTDNQIVDVFNIAADTLHLSLEDDGAVDYTIDLSAYLDNTDSQAISLGGNSLSITGNAGVVDLAGYLDNTDNQILSLAANVLDISNGNNVSLASYLDNTDAQTLAFDSGTNILTITGGNTADLSTLSHTGTTGSVFFAGADGKPTENNANFFWDNTNDRLGLGTLTPDEQLHIAQNMRLDHAFEDKDGDAGTIGQILSSTVTGTDWIDNTATPVPFISTAAPMPVGINSTNTTTIIGYNFTPTSAVSISGGNTVNSVNIISPTEMEVSATAIGTTGDYDIVISNNGVLNTEWTNNGVGLFRVGEPNGVSQAESGETCKQIIDDGYSTGDGTYWINPDGGDTSNAFQVYCDMTTDGGGWTRLEYAADLTHEAQFADGDTSRWLDSDFTLTLTDQQINDIRALSTEGKQRYHGTCQGVIHHEYNGGYGYAFGFRYHTGHETAFEQETYPSTNITVLNDDCELNDTTMRSTDFDIIDIRVPVLNVHSRDNSSTEEFGSPLTSNPAWLR